MKIFESTFPQTFRQAEIKQLLDFVTTGRSCQLVCAPGVGKATVLRLLAHNRDLLQFHLGEKEKSLRFVYINLLELPGYDETQVFKFLLISIDEKAELSNDLLVLQKQLSEAVNNLAVQNQTLILLFDHFDEYQNRLPRSFFQMLRNFKNLARYKFAAVFATRRDVMEIIDPEILREFYDFFTDNAVYLKIYDKKAAELLFAQTESVFGQKIPENTKQDIIKQAAGHAKLTKIIAELILKESFSPAAATLLTKPIVVAALQELWFFLTPREQQVLSQTASNTKPQEDEALLNLVKLNLLTENLNFTIPLFEEFVKTTATADLREKITYNNSTREIHKGESVISELLSRQEYRLLKFLVENQNRLISRDEIIAAVWPDVKVKEGISDEAIDQMIFRLRKKIEDTPNSPKHLITIKGQGLRFEP